jgi:hypothetical protein
MSNDELRQRAPSVFATEPWDGVSERYEFIPTINVVERLREEGFLPVSAVQSRARIEGKGEFTKHMLKFCRAEDMKFFAPGHSFYAKNKQPEIAQIALVNSHDRSSGYQLDAGIFRILCANGLMVCDSAFESIRVRHSGNIVDRVIEGSYKIIDEMPAVMERVEAMKALPLLPEQQQAFANAAVALRWKEGEAPVQPHALLKARRVEDQGNDLWRTFNRVQENILQGGQRGTASTGRRLTTRAVKSVSEDVRLNRALWVLAESLKTAVTA